MWGSERRALAQRDDRELASRFLADRREDLFRELYRRHTPIIYRVCVRLLSNEATSPAATAEDATQECWLRAVRGLRSFNWNSRLSTWLVGIAVRVCAELRRVPAEIVRIDDRSPEMEAPEHLVSELDRHDTERLLQQVAPGYRVAVVLHDLEGFTHEEIAAALNVVSGTVKSQLSRGRRALRAAAGQASIRTGRNAK